MPITIADKKQIGVLDTNNLGTGSVNSDDIENRTIAQIDFKNDGTANFIGASLSADGDVGLVPKPSIKNRNQNIFGDGNWDWTKIFPWAINTDYTVNNVVIYNGIIYSCNTSHTSSSSFAPLYWDGIKGGLHASTHVTGGTDVIPNVIAGGNAGLMSGPDKAKLDGIANNADDVSTSSTPGNILINGVESTVLALGTTATTACAGNDSRLSDARTPIAHATTHETGGSDALSANINTSTTNFNGILTSAENTIQKALDIIDDCYKNSIEVNAQKLQLVGDMASPGIYKVYSTDSSGVKGWHPPYLGTQSGKTSIVGYYNSQAPNGTPYPYYERTKAGTYTVNGFLFEGTDFYGTITSFVVCAYCATAPNANTHYIEWYDEINARIVARVPINSTSATYIMSVPTASFTNPPSTGRTKCAIRMIIPTTNSRALRLYSTAILN